MANALNVPRNTKLFGFNVTNLTGPWTTWAQLYADWSTAWATWVKPQIDYCCGNGIGCRVVRMIGDFAGVQAGTFTQAAYNAMWVQMADYCATLGVRVYVTGGDQSQYFGISNAAIGANVNSLLAALNTAGHTKNIIGCDISQEQNGWYGPGGSNHAAAASDSIAMYNLIKPNTSVPLTFSTYWLLGDTGNRSWMSSIASACDYLDFHLYGQIGYDASVPIGVADFDYWKATYPSKDLFIGEFGANEDYTDDQRKSFISTVLKVVANPDAGPLGALLWAGADQGTATYAKYGMYDTSFGQLYRAKLMRQATGGYVARAN